MTAQSVKFCYIYSTSSKNIFRLNKFSNKFYINKTLLFGNLTDFSIKDILEITGYYSWRLKPGNMGYTDSKVQFTNWLVNG